MRNMRVVSTLFFAFLYRTNKLNCIIKNGMKRQSSFGQYGFTLVEIMLVIVILGIISYAMSSFGAFQWTENSMKAGKLANNISNILHTGLINITIWKVESGITLTGAKIHITVGTGDSLTWVIRYQYWTNPFQAVSLFDEDSHYQVDRIWWNGWVVILTGTTDKLDINLSQNERTFSGTNMDNTATEVNIRVRYMEKQRRLFLIEELEE